MKWDKKGRNAIERIARYIAAYKGGEENRVEVSRIALFRFCMKKRMREKTKNLDF